VHQTKYEILLCYFFVYLKDFLSFGKIGGGVVILFSVEILFSVGNFFCLPKLLAITQVKIYSYRYYLQTN